MPRAHMRTGTRRISAFLNTCMWHCNMHNKQYLTSFRPHVQTLCRTSMVQQLPGYWTYDYSSWLAECMSPTFPWLFVILSWRISRKSADLFFEAEIHQQVSPLKVDQVLTRYYSNKADMLYHYNDQENHHVARLCNCKHRDGAPAI